MTTNSARNRPSRCLAAYATAVQLLVVMFAHQIVAQSPPGNQQQPTSMGPLPEKINNPSLNEVQSSMSQMSNSLLGNTGSEPARPLPLPQSQQQSMLQGQDNSGKLPMQGNFQPLILKGQPLMQNNQNNEPTPTSNNGSPQTQTNKPPLQVSNNGPPQMQNNGLPPTQNNGFSSTPGNVSPSVKVNLPQEQKLGVAEQTQKPYFVPLNSQQGSNLPPNINQQGTNFNPSPIQNNAQQLRPPQEVSFTNKAPISAAQEQVQQYQQKNPQQYLQQLPQSFSQPQQSLPQHLQQSLQQPLQQPQLSSYYSYNEMDKYNIGRPQPLNYQMPYQTQGSMNYPANEYNGPVQTLPYNNYPVQSSNFPSNTGKFKCRTHSKCSAKFAGQPMSSPFPVNFANMLPMESLSSLNPMPLAQQSVGAVNGMVGGLVDKVQGYATGLQEGLGGMALDLGTKLVDGTQAAMHTVADVAMALPDAILNAKRKTLNGMRSSRNVQPSSNTATAGGSPQQQVGTSYNNNYPQQMSQDGYNNYNMMPRPPYASGNVQQQQPFQVQSQQQQQRPPQIMNNRMLNEIETPINGPQPINRYVMSANN